MGQGQLRVIIWTTLVVLPYTMLHTKFQGHWSIGSGEEDFLRFLPYMGMAAMLVMWPRSFEQLFFPKGPGGCIWNLVAISPVVSEEKSFEIVDGRRTDGRRTTDNGACLYYKLPRSLRLRWAKNVWWTKLARHQHSWVVYKKQQIIFKWQHSLNLYKSGIDDDSGTVSYWTDVSLPVIITWNHFHRQTNQLKQHFF